MRVTSLNRSLLFLFILGVFAPPVCVTAYAQGKDKEKDASAVTTKDEKVSLEDLDSMLLPLTQEELKVELDGWMKLLRDKVRALSAAEREARKAGGDARSQLLAKAAELRDEQTALMDRIHRVIKALKDKGGDVEAVEKYVAAVSGLHMQVTDVSTAWGTVLGWIKSKEGGIRWGLNVLKALVVLVLFRILASILARGVGRFVGTFKKTSALLRDFFVNSTRKVTMFIGIIVALSMLEVDIGPFLAAIGVVGFVVGFALQDTLSNFASGIMLLIYRPYDIGDVVNAAGVLGVVDAMSLVSTNIKTFDNQEIVVPNSKIWGDTITNVTANPTRRVDLTFGIGYEDDIAKAEKVLMDIVKKHPLVLEEPAPVIKLHELADSSLNFVVRPWVKVEDYWSVYWDITRAVKERFDAEGISIPYPQQDVHLHKVEPEEKA